MKNFNDIYEKVYRESAEVMEKMRKPIRNKMIIILILIILFEAFFFVNIKDLEVSIIVFIFGLLCFKRICDREKKYKKIFKEKVIEKFVKEYDETFCYKPEEGISQYLYEMGRFDRIDYSEIIYSSEDLIEGKLDGKYEFSMAEVYVRQGKTNRDILELPVFRGLVIEIYMNSSVNVNLEIRKNTGLIGDENEDKKIKMDSSEFAKKAYVYSTDKIVAMQLLTADVIEMLLEFEEKTNIMPEITLKGYNLFIRFNTGRMFEPKIIKNTFNYRFLKKYYDIINFTLNITKEFIKNIEETEL